MIFYNCTKYVMSFLVIETAFFCNIFSCLFFMNTWVAPKDQNILSTFLTVFRDSNYTKLFILMTKICRNKYFDTFFIHFIIIIHFKRLFNCNYFVARKYSVYLMWLLTEILSLLVSIIVNHLTSSRLKCLHTNNG